MRQEIHKFEVKDTATESGLATQVGELWDKWVQVELVSGYAAGAVQLQGRIGDTWVNEGAAINANSVVEVKPCYVAMRVLTSVTINPPAKMLVTLAGRNQRTV